MIFASSNNPFRFMHIAWAKRFRPTFSFDILADRFRVLNGNDGWKPKGMHWRTFERLTDRHDYHVQTSLMGMAARFGLFQDPLDD
jgi:hypothetical protein